MVDKSVKFIHLFMLYDDLSKFNPIEIKEGYSYRFFDGTDKDIKTWVDIEVSSGDVSDEKDGYKGFETYYGNYIEELKSRCIFLLDQDGKEVGTSTAFFIVENQPGLPAPGPNPLKLPEHITGHLHWVAMREEYKGQGLSKGMISKTMEIMLEKGHKGAYLHTQTYSWLACKIYLDLGWKPFRYVESEEDFEEGWNIVNSKISNINK